MRGTLTQKLIEKKQQHNGSSIIDNDNLVPGSIACFAKHKNSLKFIGSSSGAPYNSCPCRIELSADVSLVMDPAKIVSSKAPKAVRMELLSPCWKGTPLIVAIQICQKHYFSQTSNPGLLVWNTISSTKGIITSGMYVTLNPQSKPPRRH